jgi:hypothetical protein
VVSDGRLVYLGKAANMAETVFAAGLKVITMISLNSFVHEVRSGKLDDTKPR